MRDKKCLSKDLSARADGIFIRALEIESKDERNTFVEEACAGDETLRCEVERLFTLQTELQPRFLSGSPARFTAPDIVDTITNVPDFFKTGNTPIPDDDEVGKQIGNYKLIRKIGEGGVGNVYLAEQLKPVRRQMALKIIKTGMDTKSVVARFEAERQALAMMDHPNIAHVFNAGETKTGRPYFVMELVHGERITTYCDENRLNIRDRLELFVEVCHAIQHAHQKGIIHRDIKPSNVLITLRDGVPMPMVIDFGIAKATAGDLLTENTVNTLMGPIIGTPAYMSPEQANLVQQDIDTRSDIYSLGILLYELLISKSPFEHKELLKTSLDEMCRILREQEPPALLAKFREMDPADQACIANNRHVDPRRLCTTITGDLSWIVMKAMDKERKRRYETANAMAVDIEHYLNDEPVMARPPSRLYRLQKLVRRNKSTFAYLAALGMVVFAGLGTSTWLFFREREARNSEKRLLIQADARAKIAQAALLLNRGKLPEANEMMAGIDVPIVESSLEAAGVFRTLAEWNVTQGRWQEAVACYLKLQQANQLDKSNTTREMTGDLLGAGPALVVTGKKEIYRCFVQKTLDRFSNTSDPTAAEEVIKNSLILPQDENILKQLGPFVQIVDAAVSADEPTAAENSYLIGWRTLALSLYEYRYGHFDKAVYWGQRSLGYADRNPPRIAMNHVVLAMTYAKLDKHEEALKEFATGRTLVTARLPDGIEGHIEYGTQETGIWHDWVIAYLLIQQAEALVEESSQPTE